MFLFDDVSFVQTQNLPLSELWYFLPLGYAVTVIIETPILMLGLARGISLKQRLLCGLWLTACTYPIVVLVLGGLFYGHSRSMYLFVAEIFAPVAECLLFWLAFRSKGLIAGSEWARCFAAIVVANLASFGIGEILNQYGWLGLF